MLLHTHQWQQHDARRTPSTDPLADGHLAESSMSHIITEFLPGRASGNLLRAIGLVVALAGVAEGQGVQVLYQRQVLLPLDVRSGSNFAYGLALDGGTLAVSEPGADAHAGNAGVVNIFERGRTLIAHSDRLVPADWQSALATYAVDLADGICLTSSRIYHPPGRLPGAAFVFDLGVPGRPLSGAVGAEPPGQPSGTYGSDCVVIDANTIAVGDLGRLPTIPGDAGGVVELYVRDPLTGSWSRSQVLRAPQPAAHLAGGYGRSLSYSDGVLVAGGTRGVAIFERDPSTGTFAFSSSIENGTGGLSLCDYGYAVAIEGDLLAVGLPFAGGTPGLRARVYVYRRQPNGAWQQEQELYDSDGVLLPGSVGLLSTFFGVSLDIDQGRIIVGAPLAVRDVANPVPTDEVGAAYVFEYENGQWTETYRLWNDQPVPYAQLGNAVAIDGDLAVVGAYYDLNWIYRSGRAYTFALPFGDLVCVGEPNSSGVAGGLTLLGDRRVAIGDLEAHASDLPVGSSALLIASRTTAFTAHPGGSDGNLCLGGELARLNGLVTMADGSGAARFDLEPLTIPLPAAGPTPILPGDTWAFQVWYRDAASPGGSNLTEAREVRFR